MTKDNFQVKIEYSQEELTEDKILQVFEYILSLNKENENTQSESNK